MSFVKSGSLNLKCRGVPLVSTEYNLFERCAQDLTEFHSKLAGILPEVEVRDERFHYYHIL